MSKKQKLELTWIGKENRPKLEPRILLEDAAKSYHAKHRVKMDSREDAKARSEKQENLEGNTGNGDTLDSSSLRGFASSRENEIGDIFDNKLIFGDNLLALKALEAEFAGKVKCVFIDPPYNTGSAFEHYDDALEHSTWLGLMRDRLEVIRRLLSPTGFICCHIDDSEGHYLKVLMDEVFGRSNYLVTMYVQVRYAEKTLKQDMAFHKQVEQIHVYRKDYGAQPNQNSKDLSFDKFCYYITEIGSGRTITLGGKSVQVFQTGDWKVERKEGSATGLKEIWATGSILDGNSSGRFFRDFLSGRAAEDGLGALYKVNGIGDDGLGYRYLTGPARATATKGKYYQGVPLAKLEPDAEAQTSPIENFYDLAGSFGNCRHEGGVDFRSGKKPETLLEIVLKHFSSPGDLVLDSFAGSGTTGAVAHKMGRRWIMIELGEHCHTHIIPRLQKVIDGEDKGGISEAVNWQGGGGFRYYKLAPSMLRQDAYGQWVINKEYNAEMLAQALCKLEGFTYAPSDAHYWMHGHSTERDYIYITTANLNHEQLQQLADEVGAERSLLVLCTAFRGRGDYPNLTVKKIPKQVLSRCEWGHDDYSLQVENLPKAPAKPGQQSLFDSREDAKARR